MLKAFLLLVSTTCCVCRISYDPAGLQKSDLGGSSEKGGKNSTGLLDFSMTVTVSLLFVTTSLSNCARHSCSFNSIISSVATGTSASIGPRITKRAKEGSS